MQCAIAFGADYIVTRNEKDFVYSSVRAISPECFCGKSDIFHNNPGRYLSPYFLSRITSSRTDAVCFSPFFRI